MIQTTIEVERNRTHKLVLREALLRFADKPTPKHGETKQAKP